MTLRYNRPINITVIGPDGKVVLRGSGLQVSQTENFPDGEIDVEIQMETINEQRMNTRSGVIYRGPIVGIEEIRTDDRYNIRKAPAYFGQMGQLSGWNATEATVSKALEGLTRRKNEREVAYQQEKIRNFASLYGASAEMATRILNKMWEGYPAIIDWKNDLSKQFKPRAHADKSYNGGYVERTGRGFLRSVHVFDLEDQW